MLYWYITAPDYRFASGFIWGIIFTTMIMILGKKGEKNISQTYSHIFYLTIFVPFFLSSLKNTFNLYHNSTTEEFKTVVFYPSSSPRFEAEQHIMGNSNIFYLTDGIVKNCNDFPLMVRHGLPTSSHPKLDSYLTLEMRGTTFKDGFRTRKEYLDVLKFKSDSLIHKKDN
jgi:hypothetical protein